MCKQKFSVACALRSHCESVHIFRNGDYYSAEFGGELPSRLVAVLRQAGAEILRYSHRGVVSTVVSF